MTRRNRAPTVIGGEIDEMPLSPSGPEQNRLMAAIVLLIVGLLLLLWAWGSWVYRTSPPETTTTAFLANVSGLGAEQAQAAGAITWSIMVALLLVLSFVVASMIMLRAARRIRAAGARRRSMPTPSADVWAMHRLPEDRLDLSPGP